MSKFKISKTGFYGQFGGSYVPELLRPNIDELQKNYKKIIKSKSFQKSYQSLLKNYVGRKTPLYFAKNLSAKYHFSIYLKREDLLHTGAHKINNALGQALIARKLGKNHIIAETGAGQHGVATATVCALLGLKCTVFMGAEDIQRQALNANRIKMLGASLVSVESGSKTLKDAVTAAMRFWINHADSSHYIIGSCVGPHPYPDMVALLQKVIGEEIKTQFKKAEPNKKPIILACLGGGSNAIGAFYPFLDEKEVDLIAIEAAGMGEMSGKTAATINQGSIGIMHGSMSYVMQDKDGQVIEPYSLSAGLDYPGVGPFHAYLHQTKRAQYYSITDDEAMEAVYLLSQCEGIVPALESAHAIAYLNKIKPRKDQAVVINLSGRGDKDMGIFQLYEEIKQPNSSN